jgi:hypothetical protein
MKGKGIFLILALLALAITACGSSASESMVAERQELAPSAGSGVAYDTAAFSPDFYEQTGEVQLQSLQERLIIRTGTMSVVIADTEVTMRTLAELVNERGGWVVSSNVYLSGRAKAGSMTVRIPAAEFDGLMAAVRELALEVTRENAEGQDVTEEYVDLSARLANLQATADRVRAFLDDAQTVEDALNVNRELSRLEGEIEAMSGRLQYLSQSAAYSTLTVNLTPDTLAQPLEVAGWRPQGVARDAIQTLINALQGLATLLIWVALFLLPLLLAILLPIGGLIWGFWRWRRRASRL